METALKKPLKIDKSNWVPVKFGDVVAEPRNIVKNIAKEGIEHVVGLEHIETGNIHLRNSAGIEESTTFTKKFAPGDVLFGRRRAYLKKAAQASFGGICSGDITVLRAKKGLLPELLPFIVNNDKFFDYAIKHSAGGLSPRVKFKDLANYEFLLPPEDQQAQLSELLWAMDEVIEKDKRMLNKFLIAEQSIVQNIFIRKESEATKKTKIGFIDLEWECLTLQKLIDYGIILSHLDGNHGSYYPKSNEFIDKGVPYISANCIEDDVISFKNAKFLSESRSLKIQKGIAKNGDVLLAHNATVGPVCILRTEFEKVILSTTLTYYRVNEEKLDTTYLFYYMKSQLFQSQLKRVMGQSTRNQVPITTQRKLLFIVPPIPIQRKIVENIITISVSRKKAEKKIENSKVVQKSLINQIF